MSVSRMVRSNDKVNFVKLLAVGVAAAIAVTLVLVCVASLFFSLIENIARNAVAPISYIAIALGCFLGAYISARILGNRSILIGIIIGVVFFIILTIFGCFSTGASLGGKTLFKFLVLVLSGCCGGYMGGNRRYSRRRK